MCKEILSLKLHINRRFVLNDINLFDHNRILNGFDLPSDVSLQHLDQNQEARESLLQALVPIYQQRPAHLAVNLLAESLVSLDQFIALWREHHVRVVQRVIGFKRGTGGSAGVDYLRSTVTKKAFPLLWELRSVLERPE